MGYILFLVLCFAHGPCFADSCERLFTQESAFTPQLDSRNLLVTWKNRTIYLPMSEFLLVQLLLSSDEEVMRWDDLIIKYYGRTEEGMIDAKATLKVMASKIKARFREHDPYFDQIKTRYDYGMYWVREHTMIRRGPIKVAEHVFEAWIKNESIRLTRGEHQILLRMLTSRTDRVHIESFGMKKSSVTVTLCTLNRKFTQLLGHRPILSETVQNEVFLKLNPQLQW